MKFRPLHDRVVVRRTDEDERTAGGIIIPDTAKEKPQQGEVVAVGPGATDDKGQVQQLDVRPGDRVLFGKWSGTEVTIDGETCGRAEIPFYMRMVSSVGSSVGMDHGGAVSPRYSAPFAFTGTLHDVTIVLPRRPGRAEAEATAASEMARQ